MGEGASAQSGARRAAAAVFRGAVALFIVIVLLLAVVRLAASVRERGAAAPAGTVRFQTSAGMVAARVEGPTAGPVVLIVHGTAAWGGFWKDVSARLAQQGWRVVAIDLPPFGWS